MNKKHLFWPAFIWMLLIWVLSSLPSSSLPSYDIWGIDKVLHFGIYFVWGILANIYLSARGKSQPRFWLAFMFMLILGFLDEYHQRWIPGRSVSIWDFFANALGLILAFGACPLYRKQSRK